MRMMYHEQIELSGSGGPGEVEGRLTRLQRVIGYVCALADHTANESVLDKVAALNDHKGEMNVRWKVAPTAGEKEFFVKAWESVIGDGCDTVVHEVG
jgi:hypothetical protein